jgi:hypothetical protein
MTPRIILAKYAPDLSRMEPRNIGVFVWAKGQVRAKFLADEQADFVNDAKTYARWRKFWEAEISGDEIRPMRGKPVPKASPDCMDALVSTQEGNYILVDAGEVLQSVGKRELGSVVESLYRELVAPKERSDGKAGSTLKQQCETLLAASGLSRRPDYRAKFPVVCGLYGSRRTLHASYGFGNGVPLALVQRVVLSSEASVNNAGLILFEAANEGLLKQSHCGALVQKSAINNSKTARSGYEWLRGFCQVIDVEEPTAAESLTELVPQNDLLVHYVD